MTAWMMSGGYQVPDTVMGEGGGKRSSLTDFILFLATQCEATDPYLLKAMLFYIIWKWLLMATLMNRRAYKADHSSDFVMTVLVVFL